MKAKYILRGLGLGMIITAVVMGAYTRSAVADARVAVLKEYGIGEEASLVETLVDVGESANDESENAVSPSESEEAVVSGAEESAVPVTMPYNQELESEIHSVLEAAESMNQSDQDTVSDAALNNDLESQSEGAEPVSATSASGQGDIITIEISRGDDSGTVARKLYNAGLVENAAEYDAFLMQHGYDKKLNPGTKTINATDSWQDIAEKLAKR